jgi:hypothetical protein
MKAIIKRSIESHTRTTPAARRGFVIILLLLGLRAGVIDSLAQGTVYTDRPAFTAALQSSTTVTFETLTPNTFFDLGASPITVSGVTITNFESRLFVCGPSAGSLNPINDTDQYIWNFDSSYPVGIFLPGGRNAFAADFSGGIVQNNPFNATLTFTLLDGQTYVHNFTGQLGSWTFRGFVFPQAIRSLVFDDGGPFLPGAHEEILDNLTFGVAVPEPRALVIASFAFAVWLGLRRSGGFRIFHR